MKMRKAKGRRLGGGSEIGSTVGIAVLKSGGGAGARAVGRKGWRGVPNAGEEEKLAMRESYTAECCVGLLLEVDLGKTRREDASQISPHYRV